MQLTFGMFLDGAEWSRKTASLGEVKLGPMKFPDWLESRTGLAGVSVSAPERINEYMQKIRAADPEWCRKSFALDAWSTAKQMLSLRDELFSCGWDGKAAPSKRLEALAALEAAPGPLSSGLPDRVKTLLAELGKYRFADTLVLQEPYELLPFLWKQLIDKLGECGMTVTRAETASGAAPAKFMVRAVSEFALARECARFLASGDNGKTALICEGRSAILDGALSRQGIGRLNAAERSRWRESLQILPLWLETLWKPFSPMRFLELLQLPASPVPKTLARELTKALRQEPGYGGSEWRKARENVVDRFPEGEKDPAFRRILDAWSKLENDCFREEEAASGRKIAEFCDFLTERLAPQVKDHPELALAVEHAKIMKKIVSGRASVGRTELARILDSIVSTGTAGEPDPRERTDFAVFSRPGMIDRDFDTVVWWNFIDRGPVSSVYWTTEETAVLPGYDRAAARKLESLSWRNALTHASENVIFFVPQNLDGEAVYPHPLADELKIPEEEILTQEKLTGPDGRWSLAGRTAVLEKRPLFAPKTDLTVAPNDIRPLKDLSYSQLKPLLSCPVKWFLENYLGLEMPAALKIPTGPLMLGTLAHKVVEEIYKGRETLTVEEAVGAAGERFDALLPAMAAELLAPGRKVEKDRIRRTLLAAVRELVTWINEKKLRVKDNEKKLSGVLDGLGFTGKCDIYLEDASGGKFVIDMKWSLKADYGEDLKGDRALQLAVYSWLLDPAALDVRCAYFLFPLKKVLFDPEKTWTALWGNAERAVRQRLGEIHSGTLARGIGDKKKLKDSTSALPLAAECDYCDYAALCGKSTEDGNHE